MTDSLVCSRCQLTGEAIAEDSAVPDELSRQIRERICQRCWKEWEDMEVMVINELRLNFIDPAANRSYVDLTRLLFQARAQLLDGFPGKDDLPCLRL